MVWPSQKKPTETQIEAAAEALNSIPLTISQLERGFNAWLSGGSTENLKPGGFTEHQQARFSKLLAFTTREGLMPAEIAAEAILLRYSPVVDAHAEGIDLKISDPEGYRALATKPITEEAVRRLLEVKINDTQNFKRRIDYPINDNPR